MRITLFEIVDLGIAPENHWEGFGPSFRDTYNAVVVAEGATANEAFNSALNILSLDGFDTRLLSEAGIEDGYGSSDAHTPAAELCELIDEDDEDDDDEEAGEDDSPLVYHIGIRFKRNEQEEA